MAKKKKQNELDLFDWESILVEGEDYYWEGDFKVLSEDYLKKRGKCCGSDCRHCPYGYSDKKKKK